MRHLLTILAALFLCSAPLHSQTLKALMFNSTNGQVVANTGTNVLTFTSNVAINKLELPNGTYVDDSQFAAPQYAGAFLSFEEQRLQQNGINIIEWSTNGAVTFANSSSTRANLGLPLATLTNTSNVTMMRALSGSTNTNEPYSGSISVVGTNNTNTLVFSNGILQSVQ